MDFKQVQQEREFSDFTDVSHEEGVPQGFHQSFHSNYENKHAERSLHQEYSDSRRG